MKQETISVFKRKVDLCSKGKTSDLILASFAVLGIPTNCSIEKTTKFCYHQNKPVVKAPQATLKIFELYFHGKESEVNANVVLNISHDTGYSCFDLNVKILSQWQSSFDSIFVSLLYLYLNLKEKNLNLNWHRWVFIQILFFINYVFHVLVTSKCNK